MRQNWLILLLALFSTVPSAAYAQSIPSRKLNVLFIAADDLRNDLGCYGNTIVKTPNLDRLAKRGVLFNRAYCQQALCNPSRASMMTGRRPDTLRIWDLPTHFRDTFPDVVTLPQYFKQHGYFTQNIGKIYHNWRQEIHGDPSSWSVPAMMHFANHSDDKPVITGPLPPDFAKAAKCEQRNVPDEAYFDGRVAQLSMEALRQCKTNSQPFFLAVGFWKPHTPFNAPKRYWDMYRRGDIATPKHPEWPTDAPRIAWHNGQELLGVEGVKPSPDGAQEFRHGYLANISYLDAQVGKVLDELDRLNLSEQTVIVLWGDNGYHLGEQTLWAKTSNFELDARVPLMVVIPRMSSAGVQTDALVELVDLYPTLVQVCGLPAVEGLEGVSLSPIFANPKATVKAAALTEHPRPAYYAKAPTTMGYSVRTDRYRYTEWRDWQTGAVIAQELYDHKTDPDETQNVAGDPQRVTDMRECSILLQRLNPIVQPGWKPVLPAQPRSRIK
ncbi:MAG: sulfatase [Verrucomicrobiota bacterium]